jgi:pimeloyl-ACP methyl ester carboxylesterase
MRRLPRLEANSANPSRLELEELLEKETSRRGFLRKLGKSTLALATVGAGDTLWGEFLWGGTNPEIHTLKSEKAPADPRSATLVIGGFGVANTERLAQALRPGMAKYGHMAYLENSNDGIHMGDIIDETRRFIQDKKIDALRLYGHSMGGMLAVALAANIQQDTRLDAIILDCTPASYKDVRSADQAGTLFLHAMDKASLHLGPLTRFGIEAVRPIINGRDDYLDICKHALTKISDDSCSNKLIQAQASFIRGFDARDYADIFPPELPILRLRPDDYEADGTINNKTSLPRWRESLQHEVVDLIVQGGGHANPANQRESYASTLQVAAHAHSFAGAQEGTHRSS